MSGEKTEKPTKKKIEDARKKGQVAVSKDAQIVLKLGTFYVFLFWIGETYLDHFSELLDLIISSDMRLDQARGQEITDLAMQIFLVITLPLVFVCAVVGLLATWMQIGFLVAPEGATPSFKKMDAVGNIKNMLSKKSLVQLLLSLVKVCILIAVGYFVFIGSLSEILYSFRMGVVQFFDVLVLILQRVIMFSLSVFVILAAIDWTMEKAHLTARSSAWLSPNPVLLYVFPNSTPPSQPQFCEVAMRCLQANFLRFAHWASAAGSEQDCCFQMNCSSRPARLETDQLILQVRDQT